MAIRKRTWKTRQGEIKAAWVVDYFDQKGDRHIATFARRREADDYYAKVRIDVRAGMHTAPAKSVTIAEAFQRWVEHGQAEGLEFGTIRQRCQHLRHHVEPFVGRVKLAELTLPRVNEFLAELRDAGRSLAMRRKVLTNLKAAITYAQGQGWVAQNVAKVAGIKSSDRDASAGPLREGVDFPTKKELSALIDQVSDRWRALIVTMIFTGMRISEIRGLIWFDVDLDSGVIHVRRRADAWRKIGAPKTKAGARDIPLAPTVINALRRWRLTCPRGKLDLVFPNGQGNVETLQNLRERVFLPLQRAAGIVTADGKAKYGFHALRHAAASLFIAHLGWTPKRVQTVMGHSSIQMTYDRYGHLFSDPDADREAMQKLEAALRAV